MNMMPFNPFIRPSILSGQVNRMMFVPRNYMHKIPGVCKKHAVNSFYRELHSWPQRRTSVLCYSHQQHIKLNRLGVCSVLATRNQSTQSANTDTAGATQQLASDLPPGYIPEPPVLPVEEVPETVLNALGEVPLSQLGLCNYTPAGFVQWALENLHVGLDIPWWGAIAIGTLIVRLCLFPLVIKSQKYTIGLQNHMPTIQKLQARMTKARMEGNHMKVMQITFELQEYMKRNNVKPFTAFSVPLFQVPIFLSVFVGLRGMASLPVETMKTGGLFWFTDLTVADPLHLLPFITSATLLATLEIGSDGVSTKTMSHAMKWGMRGMAVLVIPLMWKFPAAMLCYWFTANLFSLTQVSFLKIKKVRSFLGIPVPVRHEKAAKQTQKKFMEGFRDSIDNAKMMNRIENRRQADAVSFQKAGQAPLKKTYSYNPKTTNKEQAKRL